MDKEGSDLDVRGIALNSKEEVLLGTDFEQVVDVDTDTTVYSFNFYLAIVGGKAPPTMAFFDIYLPTYTKNVILTKT